MTQKPGLVQIAYDKILHDILAFALKPGDLISDYQLSKDIGMSRTPVREAIRKLMYDSLVVIGKTSHRNPHHKTSFVSRIYRANATAQCGLGASDPDAGFQAELRY